jgi:hypothetical protein
MGKSELLRKLADVAGLPSCTARQLINRPDPRSLLGETRLIVIDALDEVAAKREGDAVDLVLQKLGALAYPRFILSCRVADWQAATSVAAIREQYSAPPLQLHLEPFGRDDQLTILKGKVGLERAEKLLEHFEAYGLDFLGNPQTLDLIARLPQHRPLPTSSGALFEQAIDTLRVEHQQGKGRHELARQGALDAAGAAFAALILSGGAAIVRGGSANLAEGELHIAEVEALDDDNVARVIDTRLFAGRDDSFTYWHRRIGEFLGAAWLAKRADTQAKRRRLLHLFHAQGLVPANLRGLHAWLARETNLAQAVIAADPLGVIEYGDADELTPEQARAMLAALYRIARENPRFWRRGHARAGALVSAPLREDVDCVLTDRDAALGLRALLAEQLSDASRAQPFRETLRRLLLDRTEVFAIRRKAGGALAALKDENWPALVGTLRRQGNGDGTRLAFELMQELGVACFSDEQVVEVVLAYDGLTLSAWPREAKDTTLVRFWRLAERVPSERLDGLLETLTLFARELLPKHAGIEEHELIDLTYELILRRVETGPVEPLRLWGWLLPYEEQRSYRRDKGKTVGGWIQEHDEVRQTIQRHVILDGSDKPIWQKAMRLSRRALDLAPNEGDIVALLGALDPADRSDVRWMDVLQLIGHDGERGRAAREAAKPFVAHNPELSDWLDRLAEPRIPVWQAKQDEKARQRAAKRAMRFAEHRRDFLANLEKVRAGEFAFVHGPAQAYLKRFSDIGDDCAPQERVAQWLGEAVATAAHQGFQAFLVRRPVRPSATRIAASLAKDQRWNAGDIIVTALAERVRTRAEPFADLPDERLMAGLFELWHSRIDDHAGLPELVETIEVELKRRGAWEAAVRLYIAPQLKRRRAHVDHLYWLMRSEAEAPLATSLASEWLQSCPDLPAQPETEMIDRLLLSPRRGELRAVGDARRARSLEQERRRNWDAVQLLVDFDAGSARWTDTIEPELLWHIRARGGDRRRDERPSASISPDQLAWIVAAFRKLWPARGHPSGVTSGDANPWDASDYLFSLISRLADNTSDEAVAAIAALRDAPHDGYTDHLRAVAAEQRQKRVEQAYIPPTLHQIRSILDAGPPTDAADLQAVVLDMLDTVQGWLRGNDVDWYRGFFREDGRHKGEELCRDELIKMLRAVDNGFEYIPESHAADDKRVDIIVRANEGLILPIEIKGQWHSKLWTAADKQLDHLYVNDWRADRGIYLVLWFGEGAVVSQPPQGIVPPNTARELREALTATSKAALGGRVDVVVLDLTRPAPC